MSGKNLNLYDVLKLNAAEQDLVGKKIDRILERLFASGQEQNEVPDENIINGYTKKLCDTFKNPEARKGLLSVCRLLQELEDNQRSTVDIYNSLNGMNIDQFITITKSFRLKTDRFFCVSSDEEKVDPDKTKPALVIAGAGGIFNSKESKILKFRDNTCKVGYAYQEQWVCSFNGRNFGEELREAEHYLRRNQWAKAVEKQGYTEQDIRNKIGKDFNGCKTDSEFPNIKAHFLARKLFQKEKAKVFNIAFRGEGDSDETDVDKDKYNIFSMLNDGLDSTQKLGLFGDWRVKCFLFERINYIRDESKLNELGLRITERVLKLFLPKEQYDVKTSVNDDQTTINVVKKNDKYSEAANVFAQNAPKESMYKRVDTPRYKELDKLLRGLCESNFSEGLPITVKDFKQKLNSIDIGNIIKCINDMGTSLDKNDFVEMLSDILYLHDPDIHMECGDLDSNRKSFAGYPCSWDSLTFGPLDIVFRFIPRWLQKKSMNKPENLPSAFFTYLSNNDSRAVFSPIHYIQSLFAAPLIVKKYHEANLDTKKIIVRNINKLRNALVSDDYAIYASIVDELKFYQEAYELSSPQEAFASLICNGTNFSTKKNNDKIPKGEKDDITNICDLAYNLTEYDLDNDTREHVTQLNFVELVKNEEGKTTAGKETGGLLVIPMNAKRVFQEGEYNVDEKDWEWKYEENDAQNNKNINNQNQQDKNISINLTQQPQNNNSDQVQNNVNNHSDNQNLNEEQLPENVNSDQVQNSNPYNDNNENNNQEQENLTIEQKIVKNWMLEGGCWNKGEHSEDIKKMLEKYVIKEKIDGIDEAKKKKLLPMCVLDAYRANSFNIDIAELRAVLQLPKQEESKEVNNINNQNPNENRLLENSNNLNNELQNNNDNNNSIDPNKQNNSNRKYEEGSSNDEKLLDSNEQLDIQNQIDNKTNNNFATNNNSDLNNGHSSNQEQNNNNFVNNSQSVLYNSSENVVNEEKNDNSDDENDKFDENDNKKKKDEDTHNPNMQNSNIFNDNEQNENINNKNNNDDSNIDPAESNSKEQIDKKGQIDGKDNLIGNNHQNGNSDENEKTDSKEGINDSDDRISNYNVPYAEEPKVTVNYKAVYDNIKKSNHFCRNMCVLRAKHYQTYEKVKEKHFNKWDSFRVALYLIFVFYLPFIKKEFIKYNYNDNVEEIPLIVHKPPSYSDNRNNDPKIPLQREENLSNSKDEPVN